MANIKNIREGQVLHDYHKYKMGNTSMMKEGHWTVKVIEIDLDKNKTLCSWNGNRPKWYNKKNLRAFRVNKKVNK